MGKRFDSVVCFNMVKQIEFNGHTPLLNMKVAIVEYIVKCLTETGIKSTWTGRLGSIPFTLISDLLVYSTMVSIRGWE